MTRVETYLQQRGYEFSDTADSLLIPCPFHDDNNPSLSVQRQRGVFKCFACEEKGNFPKLIAEIDGISYDEAQDMLDVGFDLTNSVDELSHLVDPKQSKKRYVDEDYFFDYFPEIDGIFDKYLKRRKITQRSVDRCGIRCSYAGKFRNRVVVPVYDYDGRMISFNARSVFRGIVPKTMKLKRSKVVNTTLFGFHGMPRNNGGVVLVEGEFDCIFLQQFGIPAVSLMGKVLTESRLLQIVDTFDYAYLSYDADEFGRKASANHLARIQQHIPASEIHLPNGKDPNDLSIRQVFEYYKEIIPENVRCKI